MTDNRLHRSAPDSVAQWLQATGTTDATDKSAACTRPIARGARRRGSRAFRSRCSAWSFTGLA